MREEKRIHISPPRFVREEYVEKRAGVPRQRGFTSDPLRRAGRKRMSRSSIVTELVRPHPRRSGWFIDAVLVRVIAALDLLIQEALLSVPADSLQTRHAVDNVHRQAEAVDVVVDGELKRRVDVASFFVSPHVHIVVVMAAVCQPVNQPWIAVEVEDHGLVESEQGIEVFVGKSVRMLGAGLELEQVDYIDEANPDIRKLV